jgi:hypothetical protein
MGVGGQRHASAALLPGMTLYPLYRRLGRPQGRSGRVLKLSPPAGFDPRTVQLVASRYTDYAIPANYPRSRRTKYWTWVTVRTVWFHGTEPISRSDNRSRTVGQEILAFDRIIRMSITVWHEVANGHYPETDGSIHTSHCFIVTFCRLHFMFTENTVLHFKNQSVNGKWGKSHSYSQNHTRHLTAGGT